MTAFVNRKSPYSIPPKCGLCQFQRTVKKTYNAEPNPANGVKMQDVFLCLRCDLSPEPPRPLS